MHNKLQNDLLYQWDILVNAPIEDVWNLISDTDKINKLLGLPTILYNDIPNPYGGSILQANVNMLGIQNKWEEKPFEWVTNQYYSVERHFMNGLIKHLTMSVILNPIKSGVLCQFTFIVKPTSLLLQSLLNLIFHGEVKRKYTQILKSIEHQKSQQPFQIHFKENLLQPPLKKQLKRFLPLFLTCSPDTELTTDLASYIFSVDDSELYKIRPFQLAERFHKNKRSMLELFLQGTQQGLFNMSWDLLCPNCRVAKASHSTLSDITKNVHCPTCNINFEVEFDQSVELTFSPHPSVRKVNHQIYCLGGPANSTFIVAQTRLKKDESKTLNLQLDPGFYKFTSPQLDYQINLQIIEAQQPEPAQPISLNFYTSSPQDLYTIKSTNNLKVNLSNTTTLNEILIKLEKKQWLNNIVTAAYVANLQKFRDLFSSEVLKPGENIGVKSVALMFTDLKGSTKFYTEVGSAKAYSIVRNHFDVMQQAITKNDGAVVKTIGDAVMASFNLPRNAFKAALDIQKNIADFNKTLNNTITVKIGLHFGPALAVNQADTLDYFGSTVNTAARIEGKSLGHDVVMTDSIYQCPDVQEMIENLHLPVEKFETDLKGLENTFQLVRIPLTPKQ